LLQTCLFIFFPKSSNKHNSMFIACMQSYNEYDKDIVHL